MSFDPNFFWYNGYTLWHVYAKKKKCVLHVLCKMKALIS